MPFPIKTKKKKGKKKVKRADPFLAAQVGAVKPKY